jgi:hypothetical protein
MKKSGASPGQSASELISERIAELGDWRGKTLGRIRDLIKRADPDVVEEWKWRGTPVWSHDGIICTGESYKSVVKLTFMKGASLKDPARLFNSSLEGNARRAIDARPHSTWLTARIFPSVSLNQAVFAPPPVAMPFFMDTPGRSYSSNFTPRAFSSLTSASTSSTDQNA